MLNRRQINVQRANLTTICRMSVKSLIDHACLNSHVDDDSEELINFCAVFEQVVSHRLRPYPRKMWLPRGSGSPRNFWEVLLEQQHSSPGLLSQACIPTIEVIETLKSPKAKFRAFLRVALMEKRLSDYMNWLLGNIKLMRESYMEGALLASEEASVLCGDLIGLNAIDFNFCLKGVENELLGPLEINYKPFLKYKQSSASQSIDELEMLRLSGKESDVSQSLTESSLDDLLRLQSFERDFKAIKEQKDYMEELVRLRERQITQLTQKCDRMLQEQLKREREWEMERKTLDSCILELQGGIGSLRQENDNLRSQVAWLREFKHRTEMKEVPMLELAAEAENRLDSDLVMEQPAHSHRLHPLQYQETGEAQKMPDQKSVVSSVSDQTNNGDDSTSLAPLTGSLADVNAATLDSNSTSGQQRLEETERPNVQLKGTVPSDQDEQLEAVKGSEDKAESDHTPEIRTAEAGTGNEVTRSLSVNTDQMSTALDPLQAKAVLDSDDVMVVSDESVNTEASVKGTLSDPEVLEGGNVSSDGSDVTWDMLSDSEPSEPKDGAKL